MAFVVEDGTGLINANSYGSVEDADAYFADRMNTAWAGLDDNTKQAALVNATSYIDVKNIGKWIGDIQFPETPQALAFPRVNMNGYPDGLPIQVVQASFEYAVRWSANPAGGLAPDPAVDDTGRLPTRYMTKVGPITEDTQWNSRMGALTYTFRPYPFADALLRPFIAYAGQVIRN